MTRYKVITDNLNLSGKKIILRVDLNIPLREINKGHLRLTKALEMINYLRLQGAKVIVISHIGRDKDETLKPFVEFFNKYFDVKFIDDFFRESTNDIVDCMENGDVLIFENLRSWDGEKDNDEDFAKKIASFGDIYVNEAFPVSHREHASIVSVPRFLDSYIGIQFDKEIRSLSKAFNPERPFVAVIGGAKFETKIPLIKKFFDNADKLVVVGALANDIYRYEGVETSSSMVSKIPLDEIKNIAESKKVFVPETVLTLKNHRTRNRKLDKVELGEKIVDGGKGTDKFMKKIISDAKMIIWNGPFGMYEQGFTAQTKKFAKLLAKSDAITIIGGGDTLASIRECKVEDKFTFVSTGGGAMLEFLEKETLAGLDAVKR